MDGSSSTSRCAACGAVGTIDYLEEAGGEICTSCGTLVDPTDVRLEVLGRVLDGDEDTGRVHIRSFHGENVAPHVKIGGRMAVSEFKARYDKGHAIEADRYIESLLRPHNVGQTSLDRCKALFYEAKRKGGFQFGGPGKAFAAACVYAHMREKGKGVRFIQIAADADVDVFKVGRAYNQIYEWLKLARPEPDPVIFVEPHLVHLFHLISLKNPPLNAKNIVFLKKLFPSIRRIRQLANSICDISSSLNLTSGCLPSPASIAIVTLASEAIAKAPFPGKKEVILALAERGGDAQGTVDMRYRELVRLFEEEGLNKLPWLVRSGKTKVPGEKKARQKKPATAEGDQYWAKKDLVKYLEDVVKLWHMIHPDHGTKSNSTPNSQEPSTSRVTGDGTAEDDEDNTQWSSTGLDDPLVSAEAIARAANPQPVVAGAKGEIVRFRKRKGMMGTRPAQYVRGYRRELAKVRQIEKAVEDAASSLAIPVRSSRDVSEDQSGEEFEEDHLPSGSLEDGAHYRRLLLAGHHPRHIVNLASAGSVTHAAPQSHVSRARARMPVDLMGDEDMFAPGELEGYFRSDAEVDAFAKVVDSDARFEGRPPVRGPGKRKAADEAPIERGPNGEILKVDWREAKKRRKEAEMQKRMGDIEQALAAAGYGLDDVASEDGAEDDVEEGGGQAEDEDGDSNWHFKREAQQSPIPHGYPPDGPDEGSEQVELDEDGDGSQGGEEEEDYGQLDVEPIERQDDTGEWEESYDHDRYEASDSDGDEQEVAATLLRWAAGAA